MNDFKTASKQVNQTKSSEHVLRYYQKALYDYHSMLSIFDKAKAEKEKMALKFRNRNGSIPVAELDAYNEVNSRFVIAETNKDAAQNLCKESGEKVKTLLHDFPDTAFEFSAGREGVGGMPITDTYSITFTHGELLVRPVPQHLN